MNKNTQKGFIVPLIIGIVAVLIIVGGGYYLFTKNTGPAPVVATPPETTTASNQGTQDTNISVPTVTQPQSTNTATAIGDPWVAFDALGNSLKNSDITAYNNVSYKPVPSDQTAQFSQMTSFLYSQIASFNKADFINKWQDDKQAIYSTNPIKADTASSYGYTQNQIMFIKGQDGSWKVLSFNSLNYGVSKSGTNKTPAQIEQQLQAMMVDSDKDGLTDQQEVCGGSQQYNSKCVKTDPNNRDTNGNGWWDGIDAKMNG